MTKITLAVLAITMSSAASAQFRVQSGADAIASIKQECEREYESQGQIAILECRRDLLRRYLAEREHDRREEAYRRAVR